MFNAESTNEPDSGCTAYSVVGSLTAYKIDSYIVVGNPDHSMCEAFVNVDRAGFYFEYPDLVPTTQQFTLCKKCHHWCWSNSNFCSLACQYASQPKVAYQYSNYSFNKI